MTEEEVRRTEMCGNEMVALMNKYQLQPEPGLRIGVTLALSAIKAGRGAGYDLSDLVFDLAMMMLAEVGIEVVRGFPSSQGGIVQ